jgi:hypothetical protein
MNNNICQSNYPGLSICKYLQAFKNVFIVGFQHLACVLDKGEISAPVHLYKRWQQV